MDPLEWVAFGGPAGPNSESPDGLKAGTQVNLVNRIVGHPNSRFSQGFQSRDVALVELLEPFELNKFVSAICLTDEDSRADAVLCVTAGWSHSLNGGKDDNLRGWKVLVSKTWFLSSGPSFRQYIDYVPEHNLDKDACNGTDSYNGMLSAEDLCVKTKDAESCKVMIFRQNSQILWMIIVLVLFQGDFGAPLMCSNTEGVWQLHGLLSHEGVCRTLGHPDIFTGVPEIRDWIRETTGIRA